MNGPRQTPTPFATPYSTILFPARLSIAGATTSAVPEITSMSFWSVQWQSNTTVLVPGLLSVTVTVVVSVSPAPIGP